MTAINKNTFEQVYNVREKEDLSPKVSHVICLLLQRGIMVAGFNASGDLLVIHYTGYNPSKPVWALDFFEHIFVQEPLFANRDKVKGVFILGDRSLLVPDALYEKDDAGKWLRGIHYIEAKERTGAYSLERDKATYIYAAALGILELLKINFKKSAILPLPAYQFQNTSNQGAYINCFITSEQACATFYNNGQLLWHKVFDYSTAEDIAYEINHLCRTYNILSSEVTLACDTISAAEHNILLALSQFFPGMRSGIGPIKNNWDGAISLAQLLFKCVS